MALDAIPDIARSTFHRTDAGNAEGFAGRYGRDVRFDHRRGCWLLWRGHRWQVDLDAEIRRLAKNSIRHRLKEAAAAPSGPDRDDAVKWALGSESRSRLDALLFLAQAEHPIADSGERWNADPWLLGVPNGVIELRAGILRPGRRDDRITLNTTVPFESAAPCPRWLRFVAEIFRQAPEVVGFVHRAIGYSLTGNTSEQCLFLCYGTGANGKGTFTNTLMRLLGDHAWNMPFATIEMRDRAAIPNDLAALAGRRFVIASETNDGTRLNEARVKALTGCDPITARFLHREFFTFEPAAKYWLAANHRPIVRDDSHGLWRRIRLIPFIETFPVNPTLADELWAEAPGILAWAVRGCLDWQHGGLKEPAIVKAATEQYRADSDVLGEFLAEATDAVPGAEVRADEIFQHYQEWTNGRHLTERERLNVTSFGRKLGERFERKHSRAGTVYLGLARRDA